MSDDWAEVRSVPWLHEAVFLKSVLSSAGIEAMIPNEETLGIQPLYGNLLGGVRVLVRPEDLQEARALLDSATPVQEVRGDDAAE